MFTPVGTQQTRSDMATAQAITLPAGANAIRLQAVDQDVYVRLDESGSNADANSFQLSTVDGIREIEFDDFGAVFSVLEVAATATLKYQYGRTIRHTRSGS